MLLALALLTVLAPQRASAGAPAPVDPAGFGVELDLGAARLLSYAWDGSPPVPFARSDGSVHIGYGERGAGPLTRLYLPGNGLGEIAVTGAVLNDSTGVSADFGRFGNGYRFTGGSRLLVALPPPHAASSGWSLSFWMRPEPEMLGRVFLQLGGAATCTLRTDGRLRFELRDPVAESVTSPSPIEPGQWTRVALSYDEILRHLRLHVGGQSTHANLAEGAPPRAPLWLGVGELGPSRTGFHGQLDELRLEDEPVSTQRALEEDAVEPPAGPHRLVVRTTSGQSTFSPWAFPQRDAVIDSREEFERGQLDGVALDGDGLRWVPARWQRLATVGAPPPRTTHALADLGGGRMLAFGGETRDTHRPPGRATDDTWILDTSRGSWRRVAREHAPAPRCHVPAAYSPDHDLVLLVGGWRFDALPPETFSDTWVFHPSEERWEQRQPSGAALGGLTDHVLVYHRLARRFVLLQGSRVRLYDPERDVWEARPAPQAFGESGQPSAYSVVGSTCAAFDPPSGDVVLFGGELNTGTALTYRDTTAFYDLATNSFTVLDPPVRPAARARAGFARDPASGWFVLFGGVGNPISDRYADLWAFDPVARAWARLFASNAPGQRGGFYGMGYDDVERRFLLPMGRESDERWLDETLSLELAPTRTGTALFCFDRAGFGDRTRWFADIDEPGDSRVSFAFRTSSSGLDWSPWSNDASGFARVRFVQVLAALEPGSHGESLSVRSLGFR